MRPALTNLRQRLESWWFARVDEAHRCNDCGYDVSPWDNVCPNCGLASPARVVVSPIAVVGAGLLLALTLVVVKLW